MTDDYEDDSFDGCIIDMSEEEDELPQPPARSTSSLEQQIKEEEEFKNWLQSRDAVRGSNSVHSVPQVLNRQLQNLCGGRTIVSFESRFADIALKFYEQKMHEKFEVVQVLFSSRAVIAVPGFGLDRLWCHVSFTAIPKNTKSIDDSKKHFFGEMVFDPAKDDDYDVIFCSIFKPSDPGLCSCVFCPDHEIFAHPVHGCPAGGREKIDKFVGGIQMDAYQGEMVQCSRLHPVRRSCLRDDENETKQHFERVKLINVGYAKSALKIYEEKMDVKFEIVEVLSTENMVVVGNESEPEEWCRVHFTAKSINVDSSCVSPDYYLLGELLRDDITNKYKAMCCNIFKPTDDIPAGSSEEELIRPCDDGFDFDECFSPLPRFHYDDGFDVDGCYSRPLEFPRFFVTDGPNI